MPLLEENTNPNQQTNQSANQLNSTSNQKPNSLITTIGQLLPLAPFVFEQFTGQKVPMMSGTMAEVVNSLQQIQISLQTLANNQQALSQRLIALESSANNLTHQFQSLRLTHTKEKKEIEYNPNRPITNQTEENY